MLYISHKKSLLKSEVYVHLRQKYLNFFTLDHHFTLRAFNTLSHFVTTFLVPHDIYFVSAPDPPAAKYPAT